MGSDPIIYSIYIYFMGSDPINSGILSAYWISTLPADKNTCRIYSYNYITDNFMKF